MKKKKKNPSLSFLSSLSKGYPCNKKSKHFSRKLCFVCFGFSHKFWETCEVCHWGSASFKLFCKWIISDEINVYEWFEISWLIGFCNQWALLYSSVIFQYFSKWGFNMWFKIYWNTFFSKCFCVVLLCLTLIPAGPRLNIKTVLSTYGNFHVKDKTAVRTSYL